MNKAIMAGMALLGGVALTACDNINEEDRFIPVEKPSLPPQAVEKNVLIMEFSGMNCSNCPQGAREIEKIQEANPGKVIPVAVHSSLNTLSAGNPITNLNCPEADVLYKYFGVESLPTAFFNGGEKDSSSNHWFTSASEALSVPTYVSISTSSDFDNASRKATVDYSITFSNNIDENLSVMVWVLENDIKGFQVDGNQYLMDYSHNHVLRKSLNGDWGTQLGSSFRNGQTIDGSVGGEINAAWNAENCQIVVFVFNTETKAVEQSAIVDMVGGGNTPDVPAEPVLKEKTLLIQEFSGMNCSNCPQGARELDKIREANPGRVVTVGIHSSKNTLSMGNPITNLNCQEADVMYTFFGVESLPTAFFNGKDKDSSSNHWFTSATAALEQQTYISLSASAAYDPDSRQATVDYSARFSNDINEDLSIMVWVIENDITGFQVDGNQYLMDYKHNHVLRGSLNGDWGSKLGSSFKNGSVERGNASGKIDDNWNAGNCHIVVYVFRDSDKFVEQTIEIPLINSSAEEPEA